VEAYVEAGEADVRARVSALIAGKSVLSWDADKLPYGAGACLEEKERKETGRKVYFGSDSKADQGQAEIGLTGCENAIAETGTLAMTSGPGRPRTASLMPIEHVAVIRASDILLGMGEYFRKASEANALSGGLMPYVVFITGPSRTADIELSLTLGVHGPGRLIAVIGP
jgi:L-lactate dehydrogenase complex protein LldG